MPRMNEHEIEHFVSTRTDEIDHRYLTTSMTEAEYAAECRKLDAWAKKALRR